MSEEQIREAAAGIPERWAEEHLLMGRRHQPFSPEGEQHFAQARALRKLAKEIRALPAPAALPGQPQTSGEIIELLQIAYEAGFGASGEGYNGEYPFDDRGTEPQQDPRWVESRDADLRRLFPALFQEGQSA